MGQDFLDIQYVQKCKDMSNHEQKKSTIGKLLEIHKISKLKKKKKNSGEKCYKYMLFYNHSLIKSLFMNNNSDS